MTLSDRWVSRFSDDWADPTTLRFLLGGLLQTTLHLALFVLVALLATPWDSPTGDVVLVRFAAATLAGGVLGGGLVYATARSVRLQRRFRTFVGRIVALAAYHGTYAALLLSVPALGFWYAFVFLTTRAAGVVGWFGYARLSG
jgi:hypothetical protein